MLSEGFLATAVDGTAIGDSGSGGILDTFGVQAELLVAQIINFCIVTYILYRFAIKPVLKTISDRQKKIAEGLQYAEEMKAQLASVEEERLTLIKKAQEEAQALLERTKQEGDLYLQEQKKAAEEKIERMMAQSHNEMELKHRNMLAGVRSEISTLVVATTERLLENVLTDEMRSQLNQQAISVLKAEGHQSEAKA